MADTPDRIWISSDRDLKWTDYVFNGGIEYARVSANVVAPRVDKQAVLDAVSVLCDQCETGERFKKVLRNTIRSAWRTTAASTVAPQEQSERSLAIFDAGFAAAPPAAPTDEGEHNDE